MHELNYCSIIWYQDYSAPVLFGPRLFGPNVDCSAPWTIRPLDYSAPGEMEWNNGMELPDKACTIEVS